MNSEPPPESTPGDEGKNTPLYRLPRPSGQTLQQRIADYIRPDGTKGLRVRELTAAMHVAAETLQVARVQPQGLSLTNLFGLAKLMGVAPGTLVADVFHQVGQQRKGSDPPAAATPRGPRARPAAREATTETAPPAAPADPGREAHPDSDPEALNFPSETARQVAYADATLLQRSLALASVQQELSPYFPTLPWLEWTRVLDALQPPLWVEVQGPPQVNLDEPALRQLLQRLAASRQLPRMERTIHTPDSLLLARRLAHYACCAVLALAELEQNPTACGGLVRELLFRLASGHSSEEEILRVFGEDIAQLNMGGKTLPPELLPGSRSVMDRIMRLRWPPGGPGGFPLPPRPTL